MIRDIRGIIHTLCVKIEMHARCNYVFDQLDAVLRHVDTYISIRPEISMINFDLILANTIGYIEPTHDCAQFIDELNTIRCVVRVHWKGFSIWISYYRFGNIRLRRCRLF